MSVGAASNFVVNIIELQNTITNASGLSPIAQLSNVVAQLQEMVIYDEKRIAANVLSAYDQAYITVRDSLVLDTGATVTVGGVAVGGTTGSYSAVSSIGFGGSATNYYSTVTVGTTAIGFQVPLLGGAPVRIQADGVLEISGVLAIPGGGPGPGPLVGRYLTCLDASGTAAWLDPAVDSDSNLITNVTDLTGAATIVDALRGVRFDWLDARQIGGPTVGMVAQEVGAVLPEAVVGTGAPGAPYAIVYDRIIPVLVEAVKSLGARVSTLEG